LFGAFGAMRSSLTKMTSQRSDRPLAFVVEIVTSAGDDGFQFAGLTGPQRTFIVTVNR